MSDTTPPTDSTPSTTDATASTDAAPPATDATASPRADAAASTSNPPASGTGEAAGERSALRSVAVAVGQLLGDALVLGLWVVLLALVFLSTGGPRWAFQVLLLLGVVCYVLLTPSWIRSA